MNITLKIVNKAFYALILIALATEAKTFELDLPNIMEEVFFQQAYQETYQAPIGPWSMGTIKTLKTDGRLVKRAWQASEATSTVDQFAEPILDQMRAAGYQILFDCHDQVCGGFDFRFSTDVLPAPYIYVNLQNFRFVTLKFELNYKTILVSKMANILSLQLFEVMPYNGQSAKITQPAAEINIAPDDIKTLIHQDGSAVLNDLEFESGSSKLGKGPFKSLSIVAKYLTGSPTEAAILVGHTDNVGSLENNILLSEKRAAAVVERLVSAYGVSLSRLSAKGVGFLAPLTSNSSKTGRELNRRVEFVLTRTP